MSTDATDSTPPPAHVLFDRSRKDRENLFNRDRFLESMKAHSLDGVIATSAENITYTSGAYIHHLLLSMFVVTTADGEQVMVVNEADAYFVREASWIRDVRDFRFGPGSTADALGLLGEALDHLGLKNARVGIESDSMSASAMEAIRAALAGVELKSASAVFEETRMIKTSGEIQLFGAAAYVTAKAIATGLALARPGDTEKSLQASVQSAVLHLGADDLAHAHVHGGIHSTIVHAHSMEQPIAQGEVIHIDFGGTFGGYKTDIARNGVVGQPSSRQADIYRRLCEIEEMLFTEVRPGVEASYLFEIGEKAHRDVGLKYPWGTIGHTTGLAVHEGFEMSRGSEVRLEAGMIVNIEPSHIETGDARYHIEDSIVVTNDGAHWLSNYGRQHDLFEIT